MCFTPTEILIGAFAIIGFIVVFFGILSVTGLLEA